jgi:hypothetical protein
VGAASGPESRLGIRRRRLFVGLLLVPPALAGCSIGARTAATAPTAPDPLIALADAARADAALADAVIAADPTLAVRVQPLVDARTQHAAALDTEVARLDPERAPPTSAARPPAPTSSQPGLAQVRDAVLASGRAAADAALGLPAEQVGLVASIAACCHAYATVLT